jgi:hypothetical protein
MAVRFPYEAAVVANSSGAQVPAAAPNAAAATAAAVVSKSDVPLAAEAHTSAAVSPVFAPAAGFVAGPAGTAKSSKVLCAGPLPAGTIVDPAKCSLQAD